MGDVIVLPRARKPPRWCRETLKAGACVGLLGGILMALWSMLHAVYSGAGALVPAQTMGATFSLNAALGGEALSSLWGLLLHLAVSVAFAMVFAAMAPRGTSTSTAAIAGVIYALLLLFAMTTVVLPVVNPLLRAFATANPGSWVVAHILYGLSLGLTPKLRHMPGPARKAAIIPHPATMASK